MKDLIILVLFIQINKSFEESESLAIKYVTQKLNSQKDNSSSKEIPELLGTPEALKRYQHALPVTIIKYKTQILSRRPKPSIKRRVKYPKIKYGPPGYYYGEPLSYYKQSENLYENLHSTTFNEYESFYKELGPDFNFEDITFSEYEKQPIELKFYDKESNNKTPQKFIQGKFNVKELRVEASSDTNLDPEETYDVHNVNTLKTPFKDYKNTKQKVHIPHTTYGLPFIISQQANGLQKQRSKYHFGEPPNKMFPYDVYYNEGYRSGEIKNITQLSYLTPNKSVDIINYEPPHFIQPPEQYKNENGFFAEPPNNQNNFQNEVYFSDFQQELPLQNDAKSKYNVPKSSYDVPLYNSMSLKGSEQSQNNYPPLSNSNVMTSESHGSPSKILLRYAAKNATLTPAGYFDNVPTTISKINIYSIPADVKKNPLDHVRNLKTNRTRRNKNKNRSSSRFHLSESVGIKKNYEEVKKDTFQEKLGNVDNLEKTSFLNTITPLNNLLFSSTNRSQISSSNWNPLKVTAYSFKINHGNISASIPNVVHNKNEQKFLTTTPMYKRRHKIRKNRNFKNIDGISVQNLHNIYAGIKTSGYINETRNEMFPEEYKSNTDENDSGSKEYHFDYEDQLPVNSNYSAKVNHKVMDNKEYYESANSKLIRDPFDFKEKLKEANNRNHQLRYKNHRYY